MLGFWGKLALCIAGIASGRLVLVLVAAINSAISAWYYLRLVALPLTGLGEGAGVTVERSASVGPVYAAILTCAALILGPLLLMPMLEEADHAITQTTSVSED